MTPSLTHYTVLNAMQVGVIDCPPDADVPTLARTMADHRIHCVVVNGESWGIVSDLDLMASLRPGVTATAGELAASDVVAVDPEDTLEHAAAADGRARHRAPGRRVARHGPAGRHSLDARHRPLGRGGTPPLSTGPADPPAPHACAPAG